jgi:hypothetical protein
MWLYIDCDVGAYVWLKELSFALQVLILLFLIRWVAVKGVALVEGYRRIHV